MTFTPKLPAARTAPSTSALGAWSPPIASTAMVSMLGRGYSCNDFDHFAALVLSAVRANAVRQLRLMAIGTLGEPGGLQRIVRAAGAASAAWSVYVSDSAFLYLNKFRPATALRQGFTTFRFPNCGARPSDRRSSSLQSHAVSFRFLPQTGQMPLQVSLHTRCIGKASTTCSRRISSSSMPPSS